ncbi:MAG: polysaccharide deacetylase family protein [Firmicutes bacterium]|nr:polysaccharide deacetylase family protein [Bacillota bacterium]
MRFLVIKKRGALKIIIASVLVLACIISVSLTGAAKVFSGQSTRSMPIHSVERSDNTVALTFNAIDGAANIPALLQTLEKHGAQATFFVTGAWAERNPEQLKAISDSGRVNIGTLGNTHTNLSKLAKRQTELELSTSVSLIKNVTEKDVTLFRAPFGEYSDALLSVAQSQNLIPIQWDVDSRDNQNTSSYDITKRIVTDVKPGSIVLMHCDGKNTVEALGAVIEGLKNKGFTFLTINDIMLKDNFAIDPTGKQIGNTRR